MNQEIYNDVVEELKKLSGKCIGPDAIEITPETNLWEDLDLVSLDAVDLGLWIFDKYHKRVNEDDFLDVLTVKDVVDLIEKTPIFEGSEDEAFPPSL